jgi:hypothetical protein
MEPLDPGRFAETHNRRPEHGYLRSANDGVSVGGGAVMVTDLGLPWCGSERSFSQAL